MVGECNCLPAMIDRFKLFSEDTILHNSQIDCAVYKWEEQRLNVDGVELISNRERAAPFFTRCDH